MAESRLWYTHNLIKGECAIGEPHMHHAIEEYLFFTGPNLAEFSVFDAEIEILIGDHPDRMESYLITEPSVVRIPAKLWHSPITVKRVGTPVNFMPFYPNGSYGRVIRSNNPDGTFTYTSKGEDLPDNSAAK